MAGMTCKWDTTYRYLYPFTSHDWSSDFIFQTKTSLAQTWAKQLLVSTQSCCCKHHQKALYYKNRSYLPSRQAGCWQYKIIPLHCVLLYCYDDKAVMFTKLTYENRYIWFSFALKFMSPLQFSKAAFLVLWWSMILQVTMAYLSFSIISHGTKREFNGSFHVQHIF